VRNTAIILLYAFGFLIIIACGEHDPYRFMSRTEKRSIASEYVERTRDYSMDFFLRGRLLDSALLIDPHYAEAWFEKSRWYGAQGKKKEQLKYVLRAKNLLPEAYLGPYAYIVLNEYDRPQDCLESLRELNRLIPGVTQYPNGRNQHYLAGLAYRKLGKYDEALFQLNRAIQTDSLNMGPEYIFPFTYLYRGLCHFDLCQFEKAMRDFNAFHKLKEDHPDGYFRKGLVLKEMGRRKEALKSIRWAYEYLYILNNSWWGKHEEMVTESMIQKEIEMLIKEK
jgi:tetratricopeptide (TPR) repeat protein